MKHELFIASCPLESVSIQEKHARFVRDFFKTPGIFFNADSEGPPLKTTGDLAEFLTISRHLPPGITGFLTYRNRSCLLDYGVSDDVFEAAFTPSRIAYQNLVEDFPRYIVDFDAYYATIYSRDLLTYETTHYQDRNRRKYINFFHPIHFLNDRIWQTTFGITATEAAVRLRRSPDLESVQEINGGVLIIHSSKPQTLEEQKQSDVVIRKALGVEAVG